MTADEALQLLASGSPHERLKAARFLRTQGSTDNLAALRAQRSKETVSYVREALDLAIANARGSNGGTRGAGDSIDVPEDILRDVRGEAVRWISGLLLHEISSPIGLVELAASQEIPDYEQSETRSRLDKLKLIFEAIESLQGAATSGKRDKFDLPTLIDEVVFEERGGGNVEVTVHGPKPLTVLADPRLIKLALGNGLRNAIEAVGALPEDLRRPVVVTWSDTDIDTWISVIDEGPGLTHTAERVFEVGRTTKPNHSGFGLAIARQAMESLGGTVGLSAPANGPGVRYELRWEK